MRKKQALKCAAFLFRNDLNAPERRCFEMIPVSVFMIIILMSERV